VTITEAIKNFDPKKGLEAFRVLLYSVDDTLVESLQTAFSTEDLKKRLREIARRW